MKECFDYQASPILDMVFISYIKEKKIIFLLFF